MWGMPDRIGIIGDETLGNLQTFPHADNEQSGSRLRHEANRVYDKSAETVLPTDNRRADRGEISSCVRRESTADIFEDYNRRRATFLAESFQEMPEGPEVSRSMAVQSGPGTCQRQILTRKRSPSKIGAVGQILRRQF